MEEKSINRRSVFIISTRRLLGSDWKISGAFEIEFIFLVLVWRNIEEEAPMSGNKFCIDIWSLIYLSDFPWLGLKLMWLLSAVRRKFFNVFDLQCFAGKSTRIMISIAREICDPTMLRNFLCSRRRQRDCLCFRFFLSSLPPHANIAGEKYDFQNYAGGGAKMKLYLWVIKWIICVIITELGSLTHFNIFCSSFLSVSPFSIALSCASCTIIQRYSRRKEN